MGLDVMQWGMALAGVLVAITAGLAVMHLVRRVVSGCMSAGLGCLVLIIGLAAAATFLTRELGITQMQDLLELLSGMI